jgi:hypothetical protein
MGDEADAQSYPFPLPRRPQPSERHARQILERIRGTKDGWGANESWQVRAMMVMADGERDHFIKYVDAEGGSYRDGVRVERLGVAIYEDVGKLAEKPEGMDRELVRDYVLKPLVELGIAVECTWAKQDGTPMLLVGHPKAKSPNCVYRLDDGVVELLDTTEEDEFNYKLSDFEESLPDRVRDRIAIHEAIRGAQANTPHGILIEQCLSAFEQCLPNFSRVFVDVTDGARITEEDRELLSSHGLTLTLADTIPDAILANSETRCLVAIEAVTSDGEFDQHRLRKFQQWAEKHAYRTTVAVTAYPDHATFAKRQAKNQNIADGSHVWVADHPDAIFSKSSLRSTVSALVTPSD